MSVPPTPTVITEIIAGDALGMSAAARLVPAHRGTGRTSASTVWRWITTGTHTPDGRTVRLEAARVGGRWLTSRAALGRYMAHLTPTMSDEPAPSVPTRTPSQRRRAVDLADHRLNVAGVPAAGV